MITKDKVEKNVEAVVAVLNFLELLTHHNAVRTASTIARMTSAALVQLRELLSGRPVSSEEINDRIVALQDQLADNDVAADAALARKFGRKTDPEA